MERRDIMFNFSVETKKPSVDFNQTYDFVALGAGPAALNAALYAKRKGLNTLIVGYEIGGQLKNTSDVDNYLGFKMIDAEALIDQFLDHVKSLDVPIVSGLWIEKIKKTDQVFVIYLSSGEQIKTHTLLYALGGSPRKLEVPGETTYAGRGISYCVTCDGAFFRNKTVVVAGGGNSALDAAIDLARIAKKVTIIHRSQFRADQKSIDKINSLENVDFMLETQILSMHGEDTLTHLIILDKKTNETSSFQTDGIFIEIGSIPNSLLIKDLVDINDKNEIIVDQNQHTSIKGLFAAGDVTNNPFKQIIIAAAEGAKAAMAAAQYINNKGE